LPSGIWTSRSSRRSTQKNGEPAGSARATCLRARTGSESAPRLRAHRHVASDAQLRTAIARQGCAGAHSDEGALGAVPALWLPPYPRVSAPPRLRAELVTHAQAVAPGGLAGAQETATQAYCVGTPTHPHTVQGHGLG